MDVAVDAGARRRAAWRRGRGRRADVRPWPARDDVGIAAGRGTLFFVRRAGPRRSPAAVRCSRSRPVSRCAMAFRPRPVWRADLKWPNDLIVGPRKLAGILAEGIAIGTPDQAVIIGVGVNVQPAAYPPDVAARATSIGGRAGPAGRSRPAAGGDPDRAVGSAGAARAEPGDILQAWRAASPSAIGTRVEWDGKHGTTAGIDDERRVARQDDCRRSSASSPAN